MSFKELGLIEPLLLAVAETGYTTPTPVQKQAIPAVLQGGDLLAGAQTGTGKTAAFVLPMLQKLTASAPRLQPQRLRQPPHPPGREPRHEGADVVAVDDRHAQGQTGRRDQRLGVHPERAR